MTFGSAGGPPGRDRRAIGRFRRAVMLPGGAWSRGVWLCGLLAFVVLLAAVGSSAAGARPVSPDRPGTHEDPLGPGDHINICHRLGNGG
jgi:hypothetical protein